MDTITEEMEEKQEVEEVSHLPDLSLSDMCHVCNSASAYVRVRTNFGDILYCGHHYGEREPSIASAGYEVRDERARAALSSRDIRWDFYETRDRRRHR